MTKTKIEWADRVWNPTVGCRRVSEGCRNCYAERMARRLAAMGRDEYRDITDGAGHWNGSVKVLDDRLNEPLKWEKPGKVFVDSMSDLFHEDVPFDFFYRVMYVMSATPEQTYLVLTKRPKRMFQYMTAFYENVEKNGYLAMTPLPNLWLGVSVEHQVAADERIPWLLDTPAKKRFLSCEPLLGPIDLSDEDIEGGGGPFSWLDLGIHWVIVGGESGPHARPMHVEGVRSLRDQCQAADVPFFFKQWGEYIPVRQSKNMCVPQGAKVWSWDDGSLSYKAGKKAAGRELDGRTWDEVPE